MSFNVLSVTAALINGADEAGQAALAANVADIVADYEAAYPDGGEPTEPEEKEGQTFELTSGTDKGAAFVGTDKNDFYDASIVQNSFTGGVSNSLSSADKLDGGAGTDTLYAELTNEFVGATSNFNTDIQPRTADIEKVQIEARDDRNNGVDDDDTITVDAKYMTDIVEIGSKNSDGDLVIENLTTEVKGGASDLSDARNTSSITITMDHTDNFNSDGDASDLTVYFDNDYLISDRTPDSAQVFYEVMNQDAWDLINLAGRNDVELLDGVVFGQLSFTLNGEKIDLTDYLNENGDDLAIRTHQDMANAINDALTELGISDKVTATVGKDFTERTAVQTGDERTAPTVILTSTAGNSIEATEDDMFVNAVPQTERDVPASNRYDRAGDQEIEGQDNPLSVNVDLFKVGRAGEGGNLKIGAKDGAEGIDQFDIDVIGNAAQYSNLGSITSTGNALTHVNVETHADDAKRAAATDVADREEVAALIVREAFGGTLERFDANNFLGDLTIGEVEAAENINTFTATGGGNVTLTENIGATGNGTGGSFSSDDSNEYSVTTGAGSDIITIDANSGAQLTVTTGANDDTIAVSIDGEDASGSDETTATISSISGNNTVTVTSADSTHDAEINLGSGKDTVNGNSVNITVDTGAGDDVIYAENTGTKAILKLYKNGFTGAADTDTTAISGNNVLDNSLLYGQTVQVTLAVPSGVNDASAFVDGFEATADIVASNGYLTTQADLYNAIATAINEDDILSELAEASVDSQGTLTITYLVDGETTNGDELVEVKLLNDWDDLSSNEQAGIVSALQEEWSDSEINATDTETAYNAALVSVTDKIALNDTSAAAEYSFNLAGTVLDDTDTLTIDGVTLYTSTADSTAAGTIATAINGGTITLSDGVTYDISVIGTAVTLEAQTEEDTGAVAGFSVVAVDNATAAANFTQITDGSVTVDTQGVSAESSQSTNGTNSTSDAENVVNAGSGDNVIALSTFATQTDTVVFDASDIGDTVIVNFDAEDILDFSAWLDNKEYTGGSTSNVSQVRIDGTVAANEGAIINNSVVVTDMSTINDNDAGLTTALDFDTMTNNQVLAELNAATSEFGIGGNSATLVGDQVKAIIMIEDSANDTAADDNEGFYKVFEVTYDISDAEFTKASLVGTVDFGEDDVIDTPIVDANIA